MEKYRKMKKADRITTTNGLGRAMTELQFIPGSVADGTVLHAEGSFFHENQ